MGSKLFYMLLWFSVLWSTCSNGELVQDDLSEDRWTFRHAKPEEDSPPCASVKPTTRDIVKRFYAILPYFDKEHANSLFLHKYRATVNVMSEGDDILDREAAFYAAMLTPVIFLQQYRDTWCLLERFQRAIRMYQLSHPTDKRSALKVLQNLRDVNNKVRNFISNLPGPLPPTRSTTPVEMDDEEIRDKKGIRYINELIKNLG